MKIEIIVEKEKVINITKAGRDYGFSTQSISSINHHLSSIYLIGRFYELKRFLEDDVFEDHEEPVEAFLY